MPDSKPKGASVDTFYDAGSPSLEPTPWNRILVPDKSRKCNPSREYGDRLIRGHEMLRTDE